MKTIFSRAFYVAPILAASLAFPTLVQAAPGFTDTRVQLRAGPSMDFPRVATLTRNTRVNIHGCIARYRWCDVSVRGIRGWIPGDDLRFRYQGRPVRVIEYGPRIALPTLTFRFDSYWDDNYRRSSFYRDRNQWRDRYHRDHDRDGVPNRFDRDRDGDGVRNRHDRAPNNPRINR